MPAFRRGDLQHFCRPPPKDFNAHQRSTFCVYSGKGVVELRKHLNQLQQREYYEALGANGSAGVPQGQSVVPGPGGLGLVPLQADLMHFPPPAHAQGTQPGAAHGLAHAHAHGFASAAGPAQHHLYANPLPADEDLDELADEEDETGGDDDEGDGDDDDRPARRTPAAALPPSASAAAAFSSSRSSGRHAQLLNRVQSGGVRSHTSRNGGASGATAGGSGSRTSSARHAPASAGQSNGTQDLSAMRLATIPPFVPSGRTVSPSDSGTAQQALPPAMWSSWVASSPTAAQHTSPHYGLSSGGSSAMYGVQSGSGLARTSAMPFRPSPRHTAPPNILQDVPGASSSSHSTAASSSSSSHYLNPEAFHGLVDPSVARAAAEQDAYEAGQGGTGTAGGTDGQGDSRMRSASVDIQLQHGDGEEAMDMEDSEQARNGRGRRNTIRQSTYQDAQ